MPENDQPDWQDKYTRALADYQNLVRQNQRERQEYVKYATQSLVAELLPVYDSLQLASQHSQDQGVVMIAAQFQTLLQNQGITFLNPQAGEPFDPDYHECVEVESSDDSNADTIVKLFQTGARWQDGPVIRPAKVAVNRPSNSQSNQADQNTS